MKNVTLIIFAFLLFLCSNIFGQGTLDVTGAGNPVSTGSTDSPAVLNDTEFGSVLIGTNKANTFIIDNTAGGGSPGNKLNNIAVSISGSSDFTMSATSYPDLKGNGGTYNHVITFTPSITPGVKTATVTITFTNGTNSPYTFTVRGTGVAAEPEIDITGLGNSIIGDGSNTPITTDNTDFDNIYTGISSSKTFTIDNTLGTADLDITSIALSHPDYSISGITLPATISSGNSTTFIVTINTATTGTKASTVTVNNNDTDEGAYEFNITAEALAPAPEIDVRGLGNSIIGDGTNTPLIGDDTNFGSINVGAGSVTHTFTIHNLGPADLTLDNPSPYITIGGAHSGDFTLDITGISTTIAGSPTGTNSTTFSITFDPSALGTRTATVSIANNDSDEDPYLFNLQGTGANSTFTEISVSVNWPSRSRHNKVEIYSPSDILLATIDNGYTGVGNPSYSTTVNLSCIEDLSGYYYIMYDLNDDGWDGSDNITITTPLGDIVNTSDGDNASLAGYTTYFAVSGATCGAEIDVKGNLKSIIGDGSNSPSILDHTYFGDVQIVSETAVRTFYLQNIGGSDLNVSSIALTGSGNFSIQSAPTTPLIVGVFGSEAIQIAYSTTTEILDTATLTILSTGDSGEETYTINISALGARIFYDSDGDGIYDDADIDDDNDGITDTDEENACRLSNTALTTDYKFLNETFGTGTTRSTAISTLYTATTSYCIEDGDSGTSSPCDTSFDYTGVQDGEYTIASFITDGNESDTTGPTGPDIADWAWYAWANIEDHTPGDTDGRMAIFNAAWAPGVFYETEIKGTLSNVPVTYSFWVINIDNDDSRFIAEEGPGSVPRIQPNVTVNFYTSDRSTLLATFDTGDITRCSGAINDPNDPAYNPSDPAFNSCTTSEWKQFTQDFTTTETSFVVQFVNNAPGGGGNDLAIDDIEVRQTLCDLDGDGIANVFDLDSDNDGIPDVVEAGYASASEGTASLTNVAAWTDGGNGMYDPAEGILPLDSDGDGIPNYIDLDSDNDGIFDVDESGVINTNNTSFQNGDGDINGDGVGDGIDSETFRIKDANGDGTTEGFGDGILDIYDYFDSNTNYADSYGNDSQGSGPLYVLDTDNDGIPNYIDLYNDITGIYDIDTVEIYAVLPNTNGVLDDTTDTDGDGIVDSRDGNDTVFGSPRNLDESYSLYFDGRNDYIEDTNIISSGSATLMAFVKPDGTNTTGDNQIAVGQSDFYIIIDDTSNIVSAIVEGTTLTSTTSLTDGVWAHVAVTTNSGGDSVLYINGVQEDIDTSGSGGVNSSSLFMIGRATTNNNYFKGEIDEVRVFDVGLSSNDLKRMVYQELDDANGFNSGKIIPTNISASIGTNLVKYYKMDGYDDDILDDKKTAPRDVTGAKMYNFKNIYFQRAPLPYETSADGDWTNAANWLYGSEWDIMSKQDNPDDASIVHIKNNINLNGSYNTQGTVGIIVDSSREFTIEADKGLYNSWYLKLNGLLDLEGESQLVQTNTSVLESTSSGSLERDQQGTSNTYTYNYWSSPVGVTNNANNSSYTLPEIVSNVGFLTSGYNGTSSPVRNADYWIWKYANNTANDYSSWQHVRSTGNLLAGEGFTMKGPGVATPEQNYVFLGKPYNGDITLNISPGYDYLVGNPYASALDADEFIKDNISNSEAQGRNTNGNIINGALYFWDHFSNNTHNLAQYEGGYAIYTLAGSVAAISNDTRINATGAAGTKIPERYIPVGQGFFVSALLSSDLTGTTDGGATTTTLDDGLSLTINGGDIVFKNSQRTFKTEASDPSLFLKSSSSKSISSTGNTDLDTRPKMRLMFDSPSGYHRQILITADENTTNDFDLGYEALLIESNKEDMYWLLNSAKLIIQSINSLDDNSIIPLGIKINKSGLASIKIDALENITNEQEIYLHDKELNFYHNLNENNYEIYLEPGEYTDRFEITFKNSLSNKSLEIAELNEKSLQLFFSNEKGSIIINNPELKNIESIEIYNMLGQTIFNFSEQTAENYIEYKTRQIKAGSYIIKIKTDYGIVSKKVLIKQ
ncbi:choice-of-anchor D domain-containing protein [Thalassobellus sediminis]|uniref:choice-of-anchor D domain-containing protein n=1 Tax=Thalassobellus sediminis TaxID=3367753 RepID=UPI0037BB949F